MKKLLVILLLIPIIGISQNDEWGSLIFKAKNGEKFKVTVDDKSYTEDFVSEIEVPNLSVGLHKVKIDLENMSLEKKLYVELYAKTIFYVIDKKGKLKVRKNKATHFRPNAPCTAKTDDLTIHNFYLALLPEKNAVSKMETAKKFAKENCITLAQACEIAKAFENDNDRFSFLEYAYFYVSDPQNYAIASSVLTPGNASLFEMYAKSFE